MLRNSTSRKNKSCYGHLRFFRHCGSYRKESRRIFFARVWEIECLARFITKAKPDSVYARVDQKTIVEKYTYWLQNFTRGLLRNLYKAVIAVGCSPLIVRLIKLQPIPRSRIKCWCNSFWKAFHFYLVLNYRDSGIRGSKKNDLKNYSERVSINNLVSSSGMTFHSEVRTTLMQSYFLL